MENSSRDRIKPGKVDTHFGAEQLDQHSEKAVIPKGFAAAESASKLSAPLNSWQRYHALRAIALSNRGCGALLP